MLRELAYEQNLTAEIKVTAHEDVFQAIMDHTSSVRGWAAVKVIGRKVYPTIKRTAGFSPHLSTPLDFLAREFASQLRVSGSQRRQ